jgi:putative flavoprotein involved in K+ transport
MDIRAGFTEEHRSTASSHRIPPTGRQTMPETFPRIPLSDDSTQPWRPPAPAELDGTHRSVVVIGGGQAGLSMSWWLTRAGIDHVVLERDSVVHEWRDRRWENFCLVTPNWQCRLPGFPYAGDDPEGFMRKAEIIDYLESFARSFQPPVVEKVRVTGLRGGPGHDGFEVSTSSGVVTAEQVVVATGPYQVPLMPRIAERVPDHIAQSHSGEYREPGSLPDGAVLVVGSGQSGAQIAEDLHLAGRQVHLAVGSAPRVARFYRGRDVVAWLDDMGYYRRGIEEFADADAVRFRANHYVTGRDGGRDIDLRAFALDGMRLHGRLIDVRTSTNGTRLRFAKDLTQNLDQADAVSDSIKDSIDQWIREHEIEAPTEPRYSPVWRPDHEPEYLDVDAAGISTILWSTGFGNDYRWIELPVFDGRGYPSHQRGVTSYPGLYFLGLPWQHTWGSGRLCGVGDDAEHLAKNIVQFRQSHFVSQVRWIAGMPNKTQPRDDEWTPRTVGA